MSDESFIEKISNWLSTQGYPLEIRVSSILKDEHFQSFGSHYYVDKETSKPREIDVFGYIESTLNDVKFSLSIPISCKSSSKDRPWIAFTHQDTPNGFESLLHHYGLLVGGLNGKGLARMSNIAGDEIKRLKGYFNHRCHAITEAFTSGEDRTFEAIMSACKAGISSKDASDSMDKDGFKNVDITLPVVVTTARMFSSTGPSCELKEIEGTTIYWRYPMGDASPILVYVMTEKALPKYLSYVWSSFSALRTPLIQCKEVSLNQLDKAEK